MITIDISKCMSVYMVRRKIDLRTNNISYYCTECKYMVGTLKTH